MPAIIPICQVDVPCADAETATNNAASILVGTNMPESQCTAPATAAITDAIVLTAFQDVPLPEATLTIQPPDARTLVNLDTNFYTVAEPFTTSVTLLGSQVDLDISPASYTWSFGDGTVRSTTTPGAAYPDLLVTHAYESTGTVATSVTVTWGARYRVDGGPWADVAGTVDMTSPSVDLEVIEATPVLTD
ncbi:PKD domain-containing protein [Nocardioides zeae]|uniref:PKD domain-containing protein n=1 Tax=Nocardioides imazamoxiresistens TaxID=3231893 RepID=A0ABU3PWS3_9ACTN|nr:PKD domain-containing protein [Nocardioides zeae]MDT9593679.1 PKD domain-containing protein [Nocardioides zeae]